MYQIQVNPLLFPLTHVQQMCLKRVPTPRSCFVPSVWSDTEPSLKEEKAAIFAAGDQHSVRVLASENRHPTRVLVPSLSSKTRSSPELARRQLWRQRWLALTLPAVCRAGWRLHRRQVGAHGREVWRRAGHLHSHRYGNGFLGNLRASGTPPDSAILPHHTHAKLHALGR